MTPTRIMDIDLDLGIMDIELPDDLATALEYRKDARNAFAKLRAERKKEILRWIESARDEQHRIERVRMVVEVMLPNLDE